MDKHINGQFSLEQNVEYQVVNVPTLLSLLREKGVHLSETSSLEETKSQALSHGITEVELEKLCTLSSKDIFTDNAFGKSLLKFVRSYVKDPITADGVVKKGALNYIAVNGLKIPGITGHWSKKRTIKNLVTNAGFAGIASRINGAGSEAAFTYIAVGTGTTAAAVGNTTLETETAASGLSRVAATASRVTTTQTNDTAQLVTTFTVTGTVAVTESGVLNASSSGVLLCRQVFSAINVVNGDSLQVTWKVKAA